MSVSTFGASPCCHGLHRFERPIGRAESSCAATGSIARARSDQRNRRIGRPARVEADARSAHGASGVDAAAAPRSSTAAATGARRILPARESVLPARADRPRRRPSVPACGSALAATRRQPVALEPAVRHRQQLERRRGTGIASPSRRSRIEPVMSAKGRVETGERIAQRRRHRRAHRPRHAEGRGVDGAERRDARVRAAPVGNSRLPRNQRRQILRADRARSEDESQKAKAEGRDTAALRPVTRRNHPRPLYATLQTQQRLPPRHGAVMAQMRRIPLLTD